MVCVALMYSFYSLGKIRLWYRAIDFCVVSQRINLPSCVKIQISVVLLSTEYNSFFFFSLKEKNTKCTSSFLFCPTSLLVQAEVPLLSLLLR